MIISSDDIEKNRKNERVSQPIRPSRGIESDYRNALYDITRLINSKTKDLISIIASGAEHTIIANDILKFIEDSNTGIAVEANRIANQFAQQSSIQNKERFESMLRQSLNADFLTVIDGSEVSNVLNTVRVTNVGLIKTIPDQHWGKVLQAVNDNLSGTLDMPLTSRLKQISGITTRRAKFIARDQTQKAVSQLNQARQLDSGITEYKWLTSEDERVVGNPSGLYPKGNSKHMNHFKRNGKIFKWSAPPADGHPGNAINCRCVAIPVINMHELNLQVM
jgi:SPP1 gp7 family putative phage head morphogenesis protein